MSRRRFMNKYNTFKKKDIGDIIYDTDNTPIGIVCYKIQDRIGVVALNRKTQISPFGTNFLINGVSRRTFTGTGNLDGDIGLMPQDDYNGKENTDLAVNAIGVSSIYAARFCKEYNLGGYDWYMPTVSEIRWLWMNRNAINKSLNSLSIQNWQIRQFTGQKDIEFIVSSTYRSDRVELMCIRLNENGKIGQWSCNTFDSKDILSGSYPAYSSVYPFFSINI